jgi:DNA repair protein RadC
MEGQSVLHVDRFVTAELRVQDEIRQLTALDLPELYERWGLTSAAQESMWVVAYDSLTRIRTFTEVAKGGFDELDVHIPTVMSAVLLAATDRFILAHNHPNGDVSPTRADADLTDTVMTAANACGLYFEDHQIVGPGGKLFSFAASGLILPADDLLLRTRTTSVRVLRA